MDKVAEIFDNSRKINVIKDMAVKTIGAEETENVWKEARSILSDILKKYPMIQPKEQRHTDLIFPRIAVYKALLRSHSDTAMKIMEEGEAINAKERAKSYQKIVRLPFGKMIFLKGFAAGCKFENYIISGNSLTSAILYAKLIIELSIIKLSKKGEEQMAKRNHALDQPILDSARKEFLEKGFEKASLKAICEYAGVTTGAVYKRYKDKEELFAAVIEDTLKDLNQIADEKCSIDVSRLSDEELVEAWNMNSGSMLWWFQFLNDRREDFILLISKSETTRYANFQHDWVEKMTKGTFSYYEEALKRGLATVVITKEEFHILLTAFWSTIYEPFIHGYNTQQIEEHCQLVCRMFDWYGVLGFKS